jgi:hypothetical protein
MDLKKRVNAHRRHDSGGMDKTKGYDQKTRGGILALFWASRTRGREAGVVMPPLGSKVDRRPLNGQIV